MKSFILVTFGVLGFAFYELSGGDEFDAEALRVSRIDAPTAPALQAPETQLAQATAQQPAVQQAAVQQAAVFESPTEVSRNIVTLAALTTEPAQERVSVTLAPATPTAVDGEAGIADEKVSALILPSLISGNDKPVTTPEQTSVEPDKAEALFRTVSGNRVNVRGGPGTNYDVVSKLTRGQEVEILSDPGNGWVKMRPADGGSVGWLADFLLSDS